MFRKAIFEDFIVYSYIVHNEFTPASYDKACKMPAWVDSMKEELKSIH
jgi:hypothetical protein